MRLVRIKPARLVHASRYFARFATRACKPGAAKATMSFLFDQSYYQVGKNGVSPFQNMHFHLCPIETRVGERRDLCRCAYLGGSAIQTVGDNPVTAYRQLVQQYARPPRPSGISRAVNRYRI